MLSLFHCKVCREKDSRIEDLKAQIEDLRRLTLPPSTSPHQIPIVHLERDAVLSGQDEVIEIAAVEEDTQAEADRLLSGNY